MWKKVLSNTWVQLIGRGGSVGIGLLTTAWMTRNLGLEGFGRYSLLVAVFVLLDNLADFGSKMVGAKEVAAVDDKKKWDRWNELWRYRTIWAIGITGVGLGLVLGWKGFEGWRGVAGVAMVMVVLTSVAGSLEVGWQVTQKMGKKVAVEVGMSLLMLLGLWLLPGRGESLGRVIGIVLVARAVSLGFGWMVLNREMVIKKVAISRQKGKEWLIKVAPMGWYMLIFTGYDRIVDTMMIKIWWGDAQVGWYGLGYKIYANLVLPAYYLVSSALPVWVKNRDQKNWEKKMHILVMGAGVAMAGATWVAAPWMVAVLGGSEFGPTVGVLRWLSVALVASYHNHYWGFKLLATNKEKVILRTGIITLFVNIGLNLVLIPRFGIMGAAGATALTETVAGIILRRKY